MARSSGGAWPLVRFLRLGADLFFDRQGYPFARDQFGVYYHGGRLRTVEAVTRYEDGTEGGIGHYLSYVKGRWGWTDRSGSPVDDPTMGAEPAEAFVPDGARAWRENYDRQLADARLPA